MYSVSDETRKPIFEGVQGENESREIQFDISPWIEELGEGVCTATAKRPTDTTPYPVTVTRSGNVVTWKPNSTDTSIEGIGAFQLAFSINDAVAKTRIWNTKVAPSLVGAGDPPDPYDDWIQDLRDIAAETLTYSQNAEDSAEDAEAWAVGQRGGVDVPSTDPTYENNAKYYAEQSAENQYGAYIVKSASGDIASFTDGGDDIPMKSLKVTITPKQAGSGDPSPSNVRPITGWTDADVSVTGKNLLDTTEWVEDHYIGANGVIGSETGTHYSDNFSPIKSGTYLISIKRSASKTVLVRLHGYNESKQWVKQVYTISLNAGTGVYQEQITIGDDTPYIRVSITSDAGYVQIELGATATEYEPYTGHTTPVPLGQTVYGGTVDVTTGVLTIDRAVVDLATLTWSQMSGYIQTNGVASVIKAPATQTTKCNVIAEQYVASTWAGTVANGIGINGNGIMAISGVTSANGKMVYLLRTPTTVQLTPTQVSTLLGTNNVWADCGSVAVEYRADPTLAYNELANVIVSLGGNL